MPEWLLIALIWFAGFMVTGRTLYVIFQDDLEDKDWDDGGPFLHILAMIVWPFTLGVALVIGIAVVLYGLVTYPTKKQRIERRKKEERKREREREVEQARARYGESNTLLSRGSW